MEGLPLETPAFPVTERVLAQLDEWLSELAAPLPPLKKVPAGPPEANGFRWAFREETERALVIGKSVRMISAIKGAFILVDAELFLGPCPTPQAR